jgi:FMN phosphatase YigB (HAD superfamily)
MNYVLFDLDDTLIDTGAALSAWADDFGVRTVYGSGGDHVR